MAAPEVAAPYRSISVLAVTSLLLGLASPLCMLGQVLYVVPLAGIAAAVLALRQIAASDGARVGRRAAVAGLALSIGVGSVVLSRSAVTRYLRTEQAAEVGRTWVETLLAGDSKRAFRMTTGGHYPDEDDPESFGPGGHPYHKFLEFESVKSLLAAGGDAQIDDEGTVAYSAEWGGEFYVRRQYSVTARSTNEATAAPRSPIRILLTLHRTQLTDDTPWTWIVIPSS
jgi:hypothetical protein